MNFVPCQLGSAYCQQSIYLQTKRRVFCVFFVQNSLIIIEEYFFLVHINLHSLLCARMRSISCRGATQQSVTRCAQPHVYECTLALISECLNDYAWLHNYNSDPAIYYYICTMYYCACAVILPTFIGIYIALYHLLLKYIHFMFILLCILLSIAVRHRLHVLYMYVHVYCLQTFSNCNNSKHEAQNFYTTILYFNYV